MMPRRPLFVRMGITLLMGLAGLGLCLQALASSDHCDTRRLEVQDELKKKMVGIIEHEYLMPASVYVSNKYNVHRDLMIPPRTTAEFQLGRLGFDTLRVESSYVTLDRGQLALRFLSEDSARAPLEFAVHSDGEQRMKEAEGPVEFRQCKFRLINVNALHSTLMNLVDTTSDRRTFGIGNRNFHTRAIVVAVPVVGAAPVEPPVAPPVAPPVTPPPAPPIYPLPPQEEIPQRSAPRPIGPPLQLHPHLEREYPQPVTPPRKPGMPTQIHAK